MILKSDKDTKGVVVLEPGVHDFLPHNGSEHLNQDYLFFLMCKKDSQYL